MRKLASIQRIWNLEPIPDADRLELASVEGWKVVVNKGQFHPGELAVYFEIDSFLPIDDRFEFLRKTSYKKTDIMGEGFKLRTLKLRGVFSQGLLLPVSEFPEIKDVELGKDVTDILKVKKWEIEEMATTGGTAIGTLPKDVPHTDEIRVQNYPEFTEEFKGLEYYISTKMDGSSHSLSVDKNGFHVCGHNYEYKDDGTSSFYEFVKKKGFQPLIEKYYKDWNLDTFTIQGEFCAPGIQKNRLRLSQPEWYVFTIRENSKRVGLDRMLFICHELGLEHVPIEERGIDLPSKYPTIEAMLERADGEYPKGGRKEGVVVRPIEPVYSPIIGGSLSMKVVSNKYLLKNED